MVMASAALPFVFRAVEIDGVPYWDGGYTAIPRSFRSSTLPSEDVLVVNQPGPAAGNEISAGDSQSGQRDHFQFLAYCRVARDRVRRCSIRDDCDRARCRTIPAHQDPSDRSQATSNRLTAASRLKTEYDFSRCCAARAGGRHAASLTRTSTTSACAARSISKLNCRASRGEVRLRARRKPRNIWCPPRRGSRRIRPAGRHADRTGMASSSSSLSVVVEDPARVLLAARLVHQLATSSSPPRRTGRRNAHGASPQFGVDVPIGVERRHESSHGGRTQSGPPRARQVEPDALEHMRQLGHDNILRRMGRPRCWTVVHIRSDALICLKVRFRARTGSRPLLSRGL